MSLTKDQKNAYDNIIDFVKRERNIVDKSNLENRMALLKGYAGSGKSWTLDKLIDVFIEDGKTVVMTAPTNKAVRVMEEMAETKKVKYRTIHSLLNLLVKGVGSRQILVKNGEPDLIGVDVLIIDESSMVDKILLGHITRSMQMFKNLLVLFVGDEAQIPPVNEKPTKVFRGLINDENTFTLKKIVRQAKNNPIIKFSKDIRKQQKKEACDIDLSFEFDDPVNDNGIFVIENDDIITDVFTSEWNPRDFRILTYTNKVMDAYNRRIHKQLFGDTEYLFAEDELASIRTPVIEKTSSGKRVAASVEEEGFIENIERSTFEYDGIEFDFYNITMQMTHNNKMISFKAIDQMDRNFPRVLNNIASEAKAGKRYRWKEFWDLKETFTELKHSYAITTHRSQGSTFDYVMIDVDDIFKCRNIKERMKLLYVAVTRPSKSLFLKVS